ncbi:MAG: hypothetical protein IKQ40_00305 [Lachnospiraceae bacterium]|nr:hypothetical protein [Lachnospiraceae bacterium]
MKEHFFTAIRIILFISIFAVIMHLMNCVFVQSNWASIDRWEQYSKKDDIDTLFVGSSVGWVVVPQTIEGLNGCTCANMSTPNQFYKTSLEAVRFISGQQPLDTVVLMTGFETLESAEDYAAASAFINAQYETAPVMTRMRAILSQRLERYTDPDFLPTTDSINTWFDWVESYTYTIPEIYKNIAYRRGRKDPLYHLDLRRTIDRIDPKGDGAAADIKKARALDLSCIDIDERSLKRLDEMAAFLEANGIRFVVIVPPHRLDVQEEYGKEYDAIDSYMEDFVTKRGGEYYNLDLDPSLREQLPDNMFMDREHIVDEGNRIVSETIAVLLGGK